MSAAAATAGLSGRAVKGLARQPQVWFPSLVFPLFFAALNVAALNRTTDIPGFPADSYLAFLFPATLVQGVLFGSTGAASELAQDIESGFFDRLVASPVSRTSILVGRLAGGAALGAFQALVFIAVFVAFGARPEGGVAALLVMAATAMLTAIGIGGVTSTMALRTGSVEAVQASFPVVFIALFVSSAFFPRQLMHGWFRRAADVNPISHMIEGMRHLVTTGFDAGEALLSVTIAAGMAVLGVAMALFALRARLARA